MNYIIDSSKFLYQTLLVSVGSSKMCNIWNFNGEMLQFTFITNATFGIEVVFLFNYKIYVYLSEIFLVFDNHNAKFNKMTNFFHEYNNRNKAGPSNFNIVQAITSEIRIKCLNKLWKFIMNYSILIPIEIYPNHSGNILGLRHICKPSSYIVLDCSIPFDSLFFRP